MRTPRRFGRGLVAVAVAGLTGLTGLAGHAGAARQAGPLEPSVSPAAQPALHHSGKPLINPLVDLSAAPAPTTTDAAPTTTDGATGQAARRGDAKRFNTWSGTSVQRYAEAVATGDLDGDGDLDAAYARAASSGGTMTVQMNRGDGSMAPAAAYPSTTGSTDIKTGDLDGDGDLDLALVSTGSSFHNSVIDLYLNDGRGRFTRRTDAGGDGPQRMALADLDADGDLDIATSSGLFGESMSVVLNAGDGTYGPEKRYTVGDHPRGIAAADLDGDGDVDLAVSRKDPAANEAKVQVWTNNGAGKFSQAKEIGLGQPGDPSIVAADFDDDGRPDLAVGMVGTDNQVVMINRGRLAFDSRVYVTGYSAWDVTSGDLDADGDVDIVMPTPGSSATGDVSILRNTGRGTFEPSTFGSGFTPHDAAIADFDGNGKADIAVAQGGSDTGSIHLQRAGFTFGPPDLVESELPVSSLEHADVDRDDDLDLALSINDPYGATGNVQIMSNDGHAGFQPGQLISSGLTSRGSVGHVQPADVDGDGWDDLVWTLDQFNEPVGPIVTSLNDGEGGYRPPTVFPGTARNDSVAVGDLDGDGDPDLAAPQFGEQIAIYLNRGDGKFGAARLLNVAEFPGMVIISDLSGDGVVDLATVHNGVYGSSKAISVLLGTGGGRFAAAVRYTVGQGPLEIVSADLDGDGDLDLATSNNGGDDISTFADESTTVLLNRGDGRFGEITSYPGEAISGYLSEWAIDAADIDGDGSVDVVVTNVLGNNAGVYYGRGDGRLGPQVRYGLQNGALSLSLADFNGDGRIDMAASGYLQAVDPLFPPAGVVVLENRGR